MSISKTIPFLIGLLALAASVPASWAQQAATPAAAAPATVAPGPDIQPKALEILKAMSDKLDAAKTLSFSVKTAFEEPARDGQPLFYMVQAVVSLERPNEMKVVTSGDGPPTEFLYDGKSILEFLPASNMVAEAAAPPTLEAMLDDVYDKYGLYFPFIHFVVEDSHKKMIEGLTSAFVMGQSKVVGGATTDVVALANDHVQVQLWIGADDKLPRLMWLTLTHNAQKPRRMTEFSDWKLGEPVDMTPPKAEGAEKIEFARPDAAPAK